LAHQTQQIRTQVASDYADHKVFRNCTDVKLNRFSQTHTFLWCARPYAHLAELHHVNALNECLKHPLFKAGNTCTVGLLNIDPANCYDETATSHQLVVKRYNIKGILHAISRSLRTTRAAISWANAHRLMLLGLPTATPIALIEKRYFFNMLKSHSYFVTSYINAPDVALYFAQEKDKLKRAEVMREIANLFYKLYLLKLSHGDMKATNIKINHDKPVLIDLDSMQQHQLTWLAQIKHARDLKRFMRNWQTGSAQDARVLAAFTKVFKVVYQDQTPLKLAGLI
jgi:tRNA A-37 threonylcarbamoyl transferase component Bud32